MSIDWKILGQPGADNALLATVNSGHFNARLLFDCGENCLTPVRVSTLQAIDHLCFSHFHMDHVSGFDTFFRHNYNRPDVPVHVWGPPDTIEVMSHRFRAFTWNLHADQPGEWIVSEVQENATRSARFFTQEAFTTAHPMPERPVKEFCLFEDRYYWLEAMLLPHHTISSVAYRIVEADRQNVSDGALQKSGLIPGPWLQKLTDDSLSDQDTIDVDGQSLTLGDLRNDLLTESRGTSLAYLTDFRLEPDSNAWKAVIEWLQGTDTLVSECQYLSRDEALAQQHGHMTARSVGQLASEAEVGSLVLQHLSRRYKGEEWKELLSEAMQSFSQAQFPADWVLS